MSGEKKSLRNSGKPAAPLKCGYKSGNYDFSDVYPLLQGYYKVVWFDKQGFESNEVFAVTTESDELQVVPNPARAKVGII